ncbi:FMN-binding negative transcriptional regulator [Sphingomonas sp. MG17]|uniref:FMN-binding negative transcriptional regulator n=1 Tax=Sphingomonas tagetis TaxID=2949092 RepID=A0A9X2HP32_9SPHN|nr:FMN-binding negative transcriptional regulator [Sphingomonas tagetis]MCP3730923.1 FMN-binding negative transcriptional regulator [Sphingomonas tagetis]
MANGAGAKQVPLFERFAPADVRALIEAYPLAWVCGGSDDAIEASLLPLIGVYDEADELVELIGHLARSNPLYARLSGDPRASILFKGPDAYVSPEHAGRRDWGPTWNYAQVRIGAEIRFDEALTDHSLQVLTDAVESGRAAPWTASELGERYTGMKSRIIGFRARVTSLSAKFKLGQDETPETLHAILGALPDDAMTAWMRRFNPGR